MTNEFEASKPIYTQIAEQIAYQMVRGDLQPGEKLLSVRDMAVQAGVNPNTIQRTYSEMERTGIVESKRGQGTFVTENTEVLEQLKINLQMEMIETFVSNMEKLGFTSSEMVAGLHRYLEEGKHDS